MTICSFLLVIVLFVSVICPNQNYMIAQVLLKIEFHVLNIGAGHELFRYIHYETMYVMTIGHYYISYQLLHVKFKCTNSTLQQLELRAPFALPFYVVL